MNSFQILVGFLERHGAEVEGRVAAEPPAETREQLRLLAAGSLPEPEQAAVFEVLSQNPDWIAWLAREVKGRLNGEP